MEKVWSTPIFSIKNNKNRAGKMIYLTIDEASNYIQKETGIRLLNQQLYDLATRGYVSLFMDNNTLKEIDIYQIYSGDFEKALSQRVSNKNVRDIASKHWSSILLDPIRGHSCLYVSTSFLREEKGNSFCCINAYSKENCIHTLGKMAMSLYIEDNTQDNHWFLNYFIKGKNKKITEVIDIFRLALQSTGDSNKIFSDLVSPNAYFFGITELKDLNNSKNDYRVDIALNKISLTLNCVKSLSENINNGKELSPSKEALFYNSIWQGIPQKDNNEPPPSSKTINKQHEVIAVLVSLILKNNKELISDMKPHKAAEDIIKSLSFEHEKLGIENNIVTTETLANYIKQGIDRLNK